MHGLFEWVDVSVPDLQQAADFYTGLFGWDASPPDGSDGSDYLVCRRGGRLAAGIALSPSGHAGWNSYITVDSVDTMAERATAAGATVAVEPMDIGAAGRMTYVLDPLGAGLGFWQPGQHRGAEAFNEPGFLTWNELRTRDHATARAFYESLMTEWEFEDTELGDGSNHTMVKLGDRENAAIAPMGEQWGDTPAHWAVWFTVADARADLERIEGLGGAVLGSIVDTSYGPAARVADPFGTPFLIIGPMEAPG